jgi:superfamily II DNA or RNA helicase
MFELRPYQAEAKTGDPSAWTRGTARHSSLPTGCGKTVVFSSVTENQVNKGHRVLIMAHRGELLDQAGQAEGSVRA